jgi:hypothetical protein
MQRDRFLLLWNVVRASIEALPACNGRARGEKSRIKTENCFLDDIWLSFPSLSLSLSFTLSPLKHFITQHCILFFLALLPTTIPSVF